MDEHFLHFVWQQQKFNPSGLKTSASLPICVFHPGNHNLDSGPDFKESRIKIGQVEWSGHVEIHWKASDWRRHGHQLDPAYNNVILHVVWAEDETVYREDQTPIPTLTLKGRVDDQLARKYQFLTGTNKEIPCGNQLDKLPPITWISTLQLRGLERLEQKAEALIIRANAQKNDWETVSYQSLVQAYGFHVNAHPFHTLSLLLPWKLLRSYVHSLHHLEALLFGMSGWLKTPLDAFTLALSQTFGYLSKKHELPTPMEPHLWQFSKLRPANFPTRRLAQLAAALHQAPALFQRLLSGEDLLTLFQHSPSAYWESHHRPGVACKPTTSRMGKISAAILIVNVVAPLLVAYGKYTNDVQLSERAVALLEALPAESNRWIRSWQPMGFRPANAFESQAMLQLSKSHCSNRYCGRCPIGLQILQR